MTRELICAEGMIHEVVDDGWLVRAGSSIGFASGVYGQYWQGKKVYDRDRKSLGSAALTVKPYSNGKAVRKRASPVHRYSALPQQAGGHS